MTNIEKVKRILDAGHWVKVTYQDGYTYTITSYREKTDCYDAYSYIDMKGNMECDDIEFKNCTIEVIQRIPTPYKAGDKVLVLSNPNHSLMKHIVGERWNIRAKKHDYYEIEEDDPDGYWTVPSYCLAPYFDDEEISDTNRIISGKEAKIVIDGKEYTCVIK